MVGSFDYGMKPIMNAKQTARPSRAALGAGRRPAWIVAPGTYCPERRALPGSWRIAVIGTWLRPGQCVQCVDGRSRIRPRRHPS